MLIELLHILVIIGIFCLGASISILLKRTAVIEVIGLSLPIGTLYTTVLVHILHHYFKFLLNLDLLLFTIFISLFVLLAYRPVRQWFRSLYERGFALSRVHLDKVEIFLFSVLVVFVLNSVLHNLFWPISDWDALAHYDFRAKVIAETDQLDSGKSWGYFYQYPPYTSLLHVFSYTVGSPHAKVWYSLLYASFLFLFFSYLDHLSRKGRLFFTVFLAASPIIFEHSTIAYTNLAYTLFYSMSFICAARFHSIQKNEYIYLCTLFLSGSIWTRASEPFWILPILMLLLSTLLKKGNRQSTFHLLIAVGTFFIIKKIWPEYLTYIGYYEPETTIEITQAQDQPLVQKIPYIGILFSVGISTLLQRILEVMKYMNEYVLPLLYFLIPASLYSFWKNVQNRNLDTVLVWLFIIQHILFIFAGTLIFSLTFDTWDEIGGSLQRMSMFLIPLFIYGSSFAFEKKSQ